MSRIINAENANIGMYVEIFVIIAKKKIKHADMMWRVESGNKDR